MKWLFNNKTSEEEMREIECVIGRVLDYSLQLRNTTVKLGDLDLTIDFTQLSATREEKDIDIQTIQNSIAVIKLKIRDKENQIKAVMSALDNENPDWRKAGYQAGYQQKTLIEAELFSNWQTLNCELEDLIVQIQHLNSLFLSGGKYITNLLGHFYEWYDKSRVFIHLNNIDQELSIPRMDLIVITTIHELFHAWNYYHSGYKGVLSVSMEEASTEFETLYLLEKLSSDNQIFRRTYENARSFIQKKQLSAGRCAAYGFGYTINELGKDNSDIRADLIEKYSTTRAYSIPNGGFKSIEDYLYPFFSFGKEKNIFEEYCRLLDGGIIQNDEGLFNVRIPNGTLYFSEWYKRIFVADEGVYIVQRVKDDKWNFTTPNGSAFFFKDDEWLEDCSSTLKDDKDISHNCSESFLFCKCKLWFRRDGKYNFVIADSSNQYILALEQWCDNLGYQDSFEDDYKYLLFVEYNNHDRQLYYKGYLFAADSVFDVREYNTLILRKTVNDIFKQSVLIDKGTPHLCLQDLENVTICPIHPRYFMIIDDNTDKKNYYDIETESYVFEEWFEDADGFDNDDEPLFFNVCRNNEWIHIDKTGNYLGPGNDLK